MTGFFVTFEGADGSGKTTQMQLVAQEILSWNKGLLQTREPGGTPLGERLRGMLLDRELAGMDPWSEVLLYSAARRQLVASVIEPALNEGKIVLCDRFIDSTLAYQGYGRGLNLDRIEALNQWAVGNVQPHLTLVFDLPSEVGLARVQSRQKGTADRIEAEAMDFHRRVREGYLELARGRPQRIQVIDAAQSIQSINAKVVEILRHSYAAITR